jgi:Ca-activated chloride channel family protein
MSAPRIDLSTQVHPLALARDDVEALATVALTLRAPESAAVRPLNLALVIDRSSSMSGAKIQTARTAAGRVIDRMSDGDTITVVAFDDHAEVIVPATRVGDGRDRARQALLRIEANNGTNIGSGIRAAVAQLAPRIRPGDVVALFVVTDGQDGYVEQSLAAGTEAGRSVLLYAAGIGGDYNHDFLDQLCGRGRVDHVDRPEQMVEMFEAFLTRQGHLASANGRLRITPAPGARLHGVTTVEDRGQPLTPDGQGVLAIRDLAPGRPQQVQVEFVFTPSSLGRAPLGRFRFEYDLPASGVTRADVEVEAFMEVSADPARVNAPNAEVVRLARRIVTARLSDKAEKALASNDVRSATEKLKQATQKLEELGDKQAAAEFRERTEALERASGKTLDLELKRLRGTTKRMTQS